MFIAIVKGKRYDLSLSATLPLHRKSHCGGKAMWWGRACPIRPSLPLRDLKARRHQRAPCSRPPKRRAVRAAAPPASSVRDSSEIPVNCATSGGAAVLLIATVGMKKGGQHAVMQYVNTGTVCMRHRKSLQAAGLLFLIFCFFPNFALRGISLITCLTVS